MSNVCLTTLKIAYIECFKLSLNGELGGMVEGIKIWYIFINFSWDIFKDIAAYRKFKRECILKSKIALIRWLPFHYFIFDVRGEEDISYIWISIKI